MGFASAQPILQDKIHRMTRRPPTETVFEEESGLLNTLLISGILIVATALESFGDATIRIGLFNRSGVVQAATLLGGGILLFGYGALLNFVPVPFERVVGLYIATLFCVWQVMSFVTFRTVPSPQIMVGGLLIIAGGLVVTFWQR
jgi:hypothetical protein